MPNQKCKIIIVDDHPLFREGLKLIIEKLFIGEVVAEAENGLQFLELLQNYKPDVVLMDIDMPIMNGMDATEKSLEKYPNLKILIFSMHNDKKYYSRLIKAGVKGIVIKTSGKNEFETAINNVAKGDTHFSNELLRKLISDKSDVIANNDTTSVDELKLTKRDTEILKLFCCGYSASEIADKAFVSIKTVEYYRSRLLLKTGTKNTVSLVIYAIKNKLVTL
jgi:DNA-binding NarL/FixJ family response regulator